MFWTIDFLVLKEDAVTMASTHEVVDIGAGRQTASNCGPWLLTFFTALNEK